MDLDLKQVYKLPEMKSLLLNSAIGLEKENIRIHADGNFVHTPHPFGDKARHPFITTDFSEAQVEISFTDSRTLGLLPPLRLSGDTHDTPGICLIGPMGQVTLPQGVLVAQRHIHLSPEEARDRKVTDGQVVSLQTFTQRPVIFRDVVVRVHPQFRAAVHLDYDEANACGFRDGDLGRILS